MNKQREIFLFLNIRLCNISLEIIYKIYYSIRTFSFEVIEIIHQQTATVEKKIELENEVIGIFQLYSKWYSLVN